MSHTLYLPATQVWSLPVLVQQLHLIAEITYYPSHNRSANLRLWRKCHIKVPSYMNGSITSLTIQSHNYLLNDKDRKRRGRNTVGTIAAG